MTLLIKTKELCQKHGIQPKKSFGQNFLINESVYDHLIEAAGIAADDTVLEIGPGLGFLTEKLAKIAKKVITVELDGKLAEILQAKLAAQKIQNVEVVQGNILNFKAVDKMEAEIENQENGVVESKFINNGLLLGSKYKVVANLPYNITSIFLRKFLGEAEIKPEMMVLMLQKEVAKRITAQAGEMSRLSLSVQFYSQPQIVEYVSRKCFWPEPDVESAIIQLSINNFQLSINEEDEKLFFRLVKFGFSARRKMLKNNLAGGLKISQKLAEDKIVEAGFNPKIRAEDLSVDDWLALFGVCEIFML